MAVIAKWYNKSFSITPKKIQGITGFTTTFQIKSDTNDDTSGTTKTNTRGRAAEEPTFQVKYLAAAGSNPRNDFGAWRKLVGIKDYLFIGGKRYGENKFELISATISDVQLDIRGNVIQAVVGLKFKEDMPVAKANTTTSTTSKGTNAEAKSATASTTDKKLKNPYGN